MTKEEKNRVLLWNSMIWIAAMAIPFLLNLTLGATKFPWPILVPFLFVGFLLYTNNVLSKVIGEPVANAAPGTASKN